MCGRYELGISKKELEEYRKVLKDLDDLLHDDSILLKKREVFPSQEAPVFSRKLAEEMNWGFPLGKKRLINARSDSLFTKPFYKNVLDEKRVLIPALHYYEWDMDKTKYAFKPEGYPLLMAGVTKLHEGKEHFLIITTEASKTVKDIHNRMPVIIKPKDALTFLESSVEDVKSLLKPTEEMLITEVSNKQLHLEHFLD